MEKNQVPYWALVFWIFLIPEVVLGESVSLPTLGKNRHVSLGDLIGVFTELEVLASPVTQIAEVKGNGRSIRIRAGSSFYTMEDSVHKIPVQVVYSRQNFYLPPDVVEAILVNLVSYEVFYQYSDEGLVLEVGSTLAGTGFLPVRAVVIDAGHGGKDPGTSSARGAQEKDISLLVAKGLQKALKKEYADMVVYMTRDSDVFIPLEERSQMANRLLRDTKEAIFISIHCNASLSDKPSGYEIYYLSQTPTTEQARELAIQENKILTTNYSSPIPAIQAGMLSSLVQRRSKHLAENLDREFESGIGVLIPSRGVKKADFSVLRGSLMPAVLIEMGYLSHPKESVYLNSAKVQGRIVKSIVKGIKAYGDGKYHKK